MQGTIIGCAAPSLGRAGLNSWCCPRDVQVSLSSLACVSLQGKHSCPREGLIRAPSLRRAGLEGQSCCPRHVQVSASSLRRAGLEGKHSYPRDGLIRATSFRRAGLEGQSCCPRHGQVSASSLTRSGERIVIATRWTRGQAQLPSRWSNTGDVIATRWSRGQAQLPSRLSNTVL